MPFGSVRFSNKSFGDVPVTTLAETDIDPEKQRLEDENSFSDGLFSGVVLECIVNTVASFIAVHPFFAGKSCPQ